MAVAFKRMKPLVCATALACASMSVHAADYSNAIIFGDSLSDGGAYGSRFTTNPGMTAVEYAAQALGLQTSQAVTLSGVITGGNNYAQGGAMVNTVAPKALPMPISSQVGLYLMQNAGKADSSAVYFIQGGANDVFNGSESGLSFPELLGKTQQAAADLATQIQKLQTAGAQTIIVQNLPNIGITPDYVGNPMASAGGNMLSQAFNATLKQSIADKNLSVVLLDTYGLINEVVARPSEYGFTNAKDKACTSSGSLYCSPQTLVSPDAASTYVFADGVHPTTAAQKLSAQYALSVLKAPAQVGVVGAAALSGGQRYAQRLMTYAPNVGDQTWHAFADAGYSKTDFGKADSNNKYLLVGADRRISAGNAHLGLTLGYDRASGDLGASAGAFKLNETSLGAYVGKKAEQGAVMAYMRYGRLSADVDRNIALGAAKRTESGSSKGTHYTLGVQGYLDLGTFANGRIKHGPVGGFAYEKMRLNGYDEAGNTSTAMSFGAQKREGMVAHLGYQLRGDFGKIKPYASLNYEVDGTDADNISTRLKSVSSSFSTSAPKADNGLRLKVGAQIDLAKNVNLVVDAERTFGKDTGQETAVNLGVDARF